MCSGPKQRGKPYSVFNSTLKRYTPLKKSTKPIASSRTPIKKVADKRAKQIAIYNRERPGFLAANPVCMIQYDCCTQVATEVHHTEGRDNEKLIDFSRCITACRSCHDKVTEHSKQAIEDGVSRRRNTAVNK